MNKFIKLMVIVIEVIGFLFWIYLVISLFAWWLIWISMNALEVNSEFVWLPKTSIAWIFFIGFSIAMIISLIAILITVYQFIKLAIATKEKTTIK